jgi:putative aminopeptidase FrvX
VGKTDGADTLAGGVGTTGTLADGFAGGTGKYSGLDALPCRLAGAFSAQEEVGERGVQVVLNKVKPDIAIVFEGCPADDTIGEDALAQTVMGSGPMLRHFDVGMITNPRFQRFALDTAAELGIPVQEAVRKGGGTDGAMISLTGQGVPTIVIGVPVRYAHSHHCLSQFCDLEAAVKLACALIQRLDAATIAGF